MNLKKETKPGQCAAMRCTAATTPEDRTRVDLGDRLLGDVPHELCGRHYGLAVAEYGIANVVRALRTPTLGDTPTSPSATVLDTAEPTALALEAETALAEVRVFAISSQDDLSFASEILADAKARAKYVLARKEAITKPLNAALKAARDLFRPAEEHFAEIERVIKSAIVAFHNAEAEHNRTMLEAASAAFVEGNDAAVASAVAAMGSTTNTDGIGIRYTFGFEVTDPAAVEREMCSPDKTKISTYMRDAIAQCRASDVPEEDIADAIQVPGVFFTRSAGVAVKA